MGSLLVCGARRSDMNWRSQETCLMNTQILCSPGTDLHLKLDRPLKCRTILWNLRAPFPVPTDLAVTHSIRISHRVSVAPVKPVQNQPLRPTETATVPPVCHG